MTRVRLLSRCLGVVLGFGLGLSLTEVAFRGADLVRPPRLGVAFSKTGQADVRTDEQLFWMFRSRPGINSYGLRGYEPSESQRGSDLRILCVGDSVTYGWGLPFHASWPMRLERRLQRSLPDHRVETLVAAVPGYSTHQSRVLCEHVLPRFRPHVVIVCPGAWNDYESAVVLPDREFGIDLRERWRVARLARRVGRFFAARKPPGFPGDGSPRGLRVPPARYCENLGWLIDRVRSDGSELLFLVPPLARRVEQDHPGSLHYRGLTTELARSRGVPWVDGPRAMLEAMAGRVVSTASGPGFFPDGIHPDDEGQDVLGEAVMASLVGGALPRLHALLTSEPRAPAAVEIPAVWIEAGEGRVLKLGPLPGDIEPEVRLWLEGTWVDRLAIGADHALMLRSLMASPGRYRIEIVTSRGLLRTEEFDWSGLPLSISIEPLARGERVRASGSAPPFAHVRVFVEPEGLRTRPVRTNFGLLSLPWGTTPANAEGPLELDLQRFPPPFLEGDADARGLWSLSLDLPKPTREGTFAFQALIASTTQVLWSRPVEIRIP